MPFIPPSPLLRPALAQPLNPAHSAAFIFFHGLGDDATPWANVADQFQAARKLPHLQWVLPNAPLNHDAMQSAWFTPTRLSPFPSPRPELDDPEDQEGMIQAIHYVESLIDNLVHRGVPANRIVVGGFSQGHALALLTGLTSKYAGRLAGLVALSGFLPIPDEIQHLRAEANLPAKVGHVQMFIVRGKRDMLVPKRYLSMQLEKLKELGVPDSAVEVREYEGLGHATSSQELVDLCKWLEKMVPQLEETSE